MQVATLLGHSVVATTQRYLVHLTLLELRSSVPPYLTGGPAPTVKLSKSLRRPQAKGE
jgi:hypothetical protein